MLEVVSGVGGVKYRLSAFHLASQVFGIRNAIDGSLSGIAIEEHKRPGVWYHSGTSFGGLRCCPRERVFARCVKS